MSSLSHRDQADLVTLAAAVSPTFQEDNFGVTMPSVLRDRLPTLFQTDEISVVVRLQRFERMQPELLLISGDSIGFTREGVRVTQTLVRTANFWKLDDDTLDVIDYAHSFIHLSRTQFAVLYLQHTGKPGPPRVLSDSEYDELIDHCLLRNGKITGKGHDVVIKAMTELRRFWVLRMLVNEWRQFIWYCGWTKIIGTLESKLTSSAVSAEIRTLVSEALVTTQADKAGTMYAPTPEGMRWFDKHFEQTGGIQVTQNNQSLTVTNSHNVQQGAAQDGSTVYQHQGISNDSHDVVAFLKLARTLLPHLELPEGKKAEVQGLLDEVEPALAVENPPKRMIWSTISRVWEMIKAPVTLLAGKVTDEAIKAGADKLPALWDVAQKWLEKWLQG